MKLEYIPDCPVCGAKNTVTLNYNEVDKTLLYNCSACGQTFGTTTTDTICLDFGGAIVKKIQLHHVLGKLLEADKELYEKIMDNTGFAFYFNVLCKLAEK